MANVGVSVVYVPSLPMRKQPTTFQCDSDAIWTFNDGKAQKHSVSSANDGSTFSVGAWALCDSNETFILDLLLAAKFSQSRQRLLKKNTMPSGLRGRRHTSITWSSFQNKR